MPASDRPPDTQRQPKPRRWYQFGLRALLMFTLLAAGGAYAWRQYVEPYRSQRQTIALVRKLEGTLQTAAAPPWFCWLSGGDFQNVLLIDLASCDEPGAYIDAVAALPELQTLAVGGPGFTDEHLRRLHGLKTLRGLVLDSTSISDEGFAALRAALPSLDVYESQRRLANVLGGVVFRSLSNHDHPTLRSLLGHEYFWEFDDPMRSMTLSGPVDETMLGFVTAVRHLRQLRVRCPSLDADAARRFAACPKLVGLELNGVKMDDSGLGALADLTSLEVLDLGSTAVGDETLAHLQGLRKLSNLLLTNTNMGDAGLKCLAGLRELTVLDLSGTKISDDGLAALSQLTELRWLGLADTHIHGEGLRHLHHLRKLETVNLNGTHIANKAVAALGEALPGCTILQPPGD